MNYYDFPMHHQPPNQMMLQQQSQSDGLPYSNGSRRFLSEGELLSRAANNGLSIGNELAYVNRTNNTVDNIRELAGSPQRVGSTIALYNWKDASPPAYNQPAGYQATNQHHASNPSHQFLGRPPLPLNQQQYLHNQNHEIATSQQQSIPRQGNVSNIVNNIGATLAQTSGYHPAARGGVQVFPPQIPTSPQVLKKQTPTRPLSFAKALEISNSIEMTNPNYQQAGEQADANKKSDDMHPNNQKTQQIVDRGSIYEYDTNYEISVWSEPTAATGAGSSENFKAKGIDKY